MRKARVGRGFKAVIRIVWQPLMLTCFRLLLLYLFTAESIYLKGFDLLSSQRTHLSVSSLKALRQLSTHPKWFVLFCSECLIQLFPLAKQGNEGAVMQCRKHIVFCEKLRQDTFFGMTLFD